MSVRIAATVIAVSMIAAACNMIIAAPYPTRTPRPTLTPARGVTPTVVLFFPSTASPAAGGLSARAGDPTRTAAPTARPAQGQSAVQPLAITSVVLVKVERD